MNIVRGKQPRPCKAVIYGPEGIGKSSLAAKWPRPLFVDLESGTAHLDVDRVAPLSFGAVRQIVDELTQDRQGYETLVLDTADWLERQLMEAMLAEHGWRSIETPGYGKGYAMLAEDWRRFLDAVSLLSSAGMHVVFCAHAWLRKQELPDESGAFDRWELKLSKHVAPALKEWADLILFANYQTIVVTGDNGKAKAQGQERVMYAAHHACWDAKNRYGLPERLPMTIEALAPVFAAAPAVASAATAATPEPAKAAEVTPAASPDAAELSAVPEAERLPPERIAKLKQLRELMDGSGVALEELQDELARKGVCPAGMNPRAYNDATLDRIIAGWKAVSNNILLRRGAVA